MLNRAKEMIGAETLALEEEIESTYQIVKSSLTLMCLIIRST